MSVLSDGWGQSSLGLFADFYELTMLRAYSARGMDETAVFSLFVREIPDCRNVLIACGLDDVLRELESFRFGPEDIAYLRALGAFPERLLDELRGFKFAGDVFAIQEGTPFFANEPILEIAAPIGQAQLVETLVLNQMGLQTVMASKALRVVSAASGRPVVDFGARRAQGFTRPSKALALSLSWASPASRCSPRDRDTRYPLRERWRAASCRLSRTNLRLSPHSRRFPSTVLLVTPMTRWMGCGTQSRWRAKSAQTAG
jgi:nicotinate phosphoribosyltransferase